MHKEIGYIQIDLPFKKIIYFGLDRGLFLATEKSTAHFQDRFLVQVFKYWH